jgi:DnaK suppressor protein
VEDAKLKQDDLAKFKTILTQWLDELLGRAGNTILGLVDSEQHVTDPLDAAVLDSERSYTFRIRGRESLLIKKIHASLKDIENGVYGICDDCGNDIALARLHARPVARRCVRCKTRQEKKERLHGTG